MARDSYLDHLAEIPLFKGLPKRDLQLIAAAATELRIEAGKVVIREGAPAHEMVVIIEGELEVTRDGRHIADLGPGSFAGELALLAHSNRHSSVTAKTDALLLHIDGRAFLPLLEEAPQLAVHMLPIVAGRAVDNSDVV